MGHICINAADIEKMKGFYVRYFGFTANDKYRSDSAGWENYFLPHDNSSARLELLSHAGIAVNAMDRNGAILRIFRPVSVRRLRTAC